MGYSPTNNATTAGQPEYNRPLRLYPGLLLILISLFATGTNARAAAPRVVVSIAPIHALVASVMDGVGTPILLLQGFESPHNYQLRPSAARQLRHADLVVWVGEDLERFLTRPIQHLSGQASLLTLVDIPKLSLLPARQKDQRHSGHDHEQNSVDPHIWLDPLNAMAMTRAVRERLSALDPDHAALYTDNAQALIRRLQVLHGGMSERLAGVRGRAYLSYHDSYRYLDRRYALSGAGALNLHPGQQASAGRLRELRRRIRDEHIVCVFHEPQFRDRAIQTLIGDSGIHSAELDPLGANLAVGKGLYEQLMEQLGRSLLSCLSPATE